MTNVSKNILDEKIAQKLNLQLSKFFSEQTGKQMQKLFSDLLTTSEKTMLAKRLAVVIMLTEKHSTYRIAQTLKISDSTVRDVKSRLNLGQYDHLVAHYEKKKFNSKEFWETIDLILRAGLPSRGKDRWQSVRF